MTSVIRSCRIKPATPINDIKTHKLEGLDKNNYSYTKLYYGFSKFALLPYEKIIEKIKHDLSILQDGFSMLAGTIEYDYETNNAQLIYDGNGLVFVEAENNSIEMKDLSILNDDHDMKATQVISSMFTPDTDSLEQQYGVQHFPFIVQVTKLKCNSIILTTVNSHMLMDGSTYELVQRAWKSVSQGLGYEKPDDKMIDYKHIKAQSKKPQGWIEIPKKLLFQTKSKESQFTPSRLFHFSREKLNLLKEELNQKIKQQEGGASYVTTDEILSAILWKSVVKYRKLDKEQQTTFVRPTNIRGLLSPMLSKNSVGNLAIMNGITLPVGRILSMDKLEIIKEIQLQKALFDKEKILQNMKFFTELPFDKALIMDIAGLAQNDVFINSWSKFTSLSSFDIGFGNNIFVCLPPLMDGAIIILPTCFNQKEGLVAYVTSPENLLLDLKNDAELSGYLY